MSGESVPQEDLQGLMALLDDVRCEVIEAQKQIATAKSGIPDGLQAQLDAIWSAVSHPVPDASLPLLEELLQVLAPKPVTRPWWHRWVWPSAGVLLGVLCFGLGWWQGSPTREARLWGTLGQQVDRVLVEQYLGLSRSAQEALNKLYRDLRMVTPGDRKGKRA
jgi:hypothetical protein